LEKTNYCKSNTNLVGSLQFAVGSLQFERSEIPNLLRDGSSQFGIGEKAFFPAKLLTRRLVSSYIRHLVL
jgi:hypothetical protein